MNTTDNQADLDALPRGTILHRYMIDGVIGHGGFGITYRARDTDDEIFAVKEYLPRQFALRQGTDVVPIGASVRPAYDAGLGCFIKEAKALRRLSAVGATGGGVVKVTNLFEGNGTAYLVMEYLTGQRLDALLQAHPEGLVEDVLNPLMRRLLRALACVHGAGFRHGDVKPANIMLRKDGKPILIDFAGARGTSEGKTVTATEILSEGYAPIEQFLGAEQGPFSDIYALGETLYQAIGGKPVDAFARHQALLRGLPDPQPPAAEIGDRRYDPRLLLAIDQSLSVAPEARPQSVAAVVAILDYIEPEPAPPEPEPLPVEAPPVAPTPPAAELPATGPEPAPERVDTPTRPPMPLSWNSPSPIPVSTGEPSAPPARLQAFGLPFIAGVVVAGLVGGAAWFLLRPPAAPPAQVASALPAPETPVPLTIPPPDSAARRPVAETPPTRPPTSTAAKPVAVEPTKPVAVEPAKPLPAEPTKPASVELPKPAPAEAPKPISVEPAKPAPVEPPKPAVVEPVKPPPVELPKPVAIELPKPVAVEPAKPPAVEPPRPAVKPAAPSEPIRLAPAEPARPVAAEPVRPSSGATDPAPANPTVPGPVARDPRAQPDPVPRYQPPATMEDGPVGGRVSGPSLIYPPAMKESGREGSADVSCTIDAEGKAGDCKLIGLWGPPEFGMSALAYVRGSTYRPARRDGVTVSEKGRFHIEFKLAE